VPNSCFRQRAQVIETTDVADPNFTHDVIAVSIWTELSDRRHGFSRHAGSFSNVFCLLPAPYGPM
jgi:hypothetical protein